MSTSTVPLWPGIRYRGLDRLPSQRLPLLEVTAGSKASVTADRLADALSTGTPLGGYGPISSGFRSQIPGLTSGLSVKVRLAEPGPKVPVAPGDATAGERSGSPGKYSMSKVTGVLPSALDTL